MSQLARNVGVLLCSPIGQEYMRTHWAFRQLANLLSRVGFHVFRFDYFGTGDSAGQSGEGNVIQWRNDIRIAVDELKDMSSVKKVSMVGLRLGAALAATSSSDGLDVKDLVLWDPVVNGKSYIEELKALHYALLPRPGEKAADRSFDELLGFPLSTEMRAAIEQIDLLEKPQLMAERMFLIVSEERNEYLQLRDQMISAGLQPDYRVIPDANNWEKVEEIDKALLVNDILHAITAALTS